MSRAAEEMEDGADRASDRVLWQRCCATDAPEDDAACFLDLAAFSDGRLDDEDEQDRVAALLAADPAAAADVTAARESAVDQASAGLERIIQRACAIVLDPAPTRGRVVPFAPSRLYRPVLQSLAQWGSLAAAIVVASWLGFAMGRDASLALIQPVQPSDTSYLPEFFDPATGFLRDIGEGART